jgi:uncharacterized protein DUF6298
MLRKSFIQAVQGVLLLSILFMSGCNPTGTPAVPSATPTGAASTSTPTVAPAITPANETPTPQAVRALGPLFVNPDNPRYFTDGTKVEDKYKVVYLTGSHTWCNLMDCGNTNPPVAFDYGKYLDFLESRNLNFFRLWRTENARGGEAGADFWFDPMPYARSSECCAFDGGNKFDLMQFNQEYFDRMRERLIEAGDRGMYVSIMLFDGWSVESKFGGHDPWAGHPYNLQNNINDIDGEVNGNGSGEETHILMDTPVTALQEAYVRKVIDTVNDLDNVMYEISNESPGDNPGTSQTDGSRDWQYHMIEFVKDYEAGKPKQHPVGMTAFWPNYSESDLYNSPADWISLGSNVDINTYEPPVANGDKVIIADTDHLCGICGNQSWVWKSFTRGENPIFMDVYDPETTGRGMYLAPTGNEEEIRTSLGYTHEFADRIDLVSMTPQPNICSSGYCLANFLGKGAQYLIFLPAGEEVAKIFDKLGVENAPPVNLPGEGELQVDLSASPVELSVEWFNVREGEKIPAGTVQGGSLQTFKAPFSGDAVLYLYGSSQ